MFYPIAAFGFFIMSKVICKACCSYHKNLPQGNSQQFHFGKYKSVLVSESNDLSYLKLAIENIKCTSSMKQSMQKRILSPENMLR